MSIIRHILALLLVAIAIGCTRDASKPVAVSRLDKAMSAYNGASPADREAIADSMSAEIAALFKTLGYETVGEPELTWWSTGDEVATFQPDVDAAFPNISDIEATIGEIYFNASRQGLPLDSLHFSAIVYGRPMPLVRVDSVMLIALNHYLGADYPGYSHWEEYKRAEKTPSTLPYDIAAAITSTSHPMRATSPTLLSNMLYEGALVEARMKLLHKPDLAAALGVTQQQLEFMQDNLPDMWREMNEKRMLYDTNPLTSDRLLSGAPSSPLLRGQAPGRAGRFVGYCIVKSYLKSHPEAKLADLFAPAFYASPAIVAESGFNPK